MHPLLQLLKGNTKWKWDETSMRAFNEVKKLFIEDMMLRHPKYDKPFTLYTDASNLGLGRF